MDGHPVPASSNSKICCSLENFTLDAERWLASLHWCVRTSYGDDAAQAAADCWLQVFEDRLEGSSDLPELTRITSAAIALFVSRLVLTGQTTHPPDLCMPCQIGPRKRPFRNHLDSLIDASLGWKHLSGGTVRGHINAKGRHEGLQIRENPCTYYVPKNRVSRVLVVLSA